MYRMVDLIERKKRGGELTEAQLRFFVAGVMDGSIPDYQTSALLMAIRLCGMTARETAELTLAMARSGRMDDLSDLSAVTADKHSTGGVSDSTSLVVLPVLAACGVTVCKASGRGLGFTGGTIDKLESIPGFRVDLTNEERRRIARECGAVLTGATAELAPVDKILYALRDVTATVDSLPLIASSVMSKKLAGGAAHILLDVKYGSGALMKTAEDAVALSKSMAEIGARLGRDTACLISSMEQPLSPYVGCNLEVRAVMRVLRGEVNRLFKVSRELTARLLVMCGKAENVEEGARMFEECVASGRAEAKLLEMVRLQGGDVSVLEKAEERLPCAPISRKIAAPTDGYVQSIDCERVGVCCCLLGGGRREKGDEIDHGAGLIYYPEVGARFRKGQTVAELFTSDRSKLDEAEQEIVKSFTPGSGKPAEPALFYALVDRNGIQRRQTPSVG